jgi:hypothetical protein
MEQVCVCMQGSYFEGDWVGVVICPTITVLYHISWILLTAPCIGPIIINIGTGWRLTSHSPSFHPWKDHHSVGGYVGLVASLNVEEKVNLKLQLGFKFQSIQPIT